MKNRITIQAKDPAAQSLLRAALKWVRRIEERKQDLPKSFIDNCDPKPLRKKIEAYLK